MSTSNSNLCFCDPNQSFQAGCIYRNNGNLRSPQPTVVDMATTSSRPSTPVKAEGGKAPVTTCPAVSPPAKRKREAATDLSDLKSTNDAILFQPPKNKRSKQHATYSISFQPNHYTLLDEHPDDHTSPGSSMPPVRPVDRIERKPSRNPQKSAVKDDDEDWGDNIIREAANHDLDIIQNALLQTEAQNTELQRSLADCQGQVLRAKQDMLLAHIMQQDVHKKQLRQTQKEKGRIQKCADTEKTVKLELEKTLKAVTVKLNTTTSRNKTLQNDSDHLHTVIKTLHDDLDELRQLESEEFARRKEQEQRRQLPPAYEDHRERDQQAPYQQHTDTSAFDKKNLEDLVKKDIKEDFDDALRKAHNTRIDYLKSDNSTLQTKAHSIIFTALADILAEACSRVRPVLRCTDGMGDWIAELLLELSWKVVSSCEVRPCTIHLTAPEKNRAGFAFKDLDELLLETVKQRLDDIGPDYLLQVYELQKYLTRTLALQNSFSILDARTGFDYFGKTVQWLSDQVEHERQRQANAPS